MKRSFVLKKDYYIKLIFFTYVRILFRIMFLRANDHWEIDIFKGKIN